MTSRQAIEHALASDPLARGIELTLAAAGLVAVALALVGLWVSAASDLRDEQGELYDLEADGVAPAALRTQLRVRAAVLVAVGLVGGLILGVVLSLGTADLVLLSANGTAPFRPCCGSPTGRRWRPERRWSCSPPPLWSRSPSAGPSASASAPGSRSAPVTAAAREPVIDVRDVFRIYRAEERESVALQGLTLSVAPGELVVVLGPSGSGKSTLLRLLAGFDRPTAGVARVLGLEPRAVERPRGGGLPCPLAGGWGWGPALRPRPLAGPHLDPGHRRAPACPARGTLPAERRRRAEGMLEWAGLLDRADDLPAALSGG